MPFSPFAATHFRRWRDFGKEDGHTAAIQCEPDAPLRMADAGSRDAGGRAIWLALLDEARHIPVINFPRAAIRTNTIVSSARSPDWFRGLLYYEASEDYHWVTSWY